MLETIADVFANKYSEKPTWQRFIIGTVAFISIWVLLGAIDLFFFR